MALTQRITCDVCPKIKGEANHWFMFHARAGEITFEPWDETEFEFKSHACSEACCVTILARTLTRWGERRSVEAANHAKDVPVAIRR